MRYSIVNVIAFCIIISNIIASHLQPVQNIVKDSLWPKTLSFFNDEDKWYKLPPTEESISFSVNSISVYENHMRQLWDVYRRIIYDTTPENMYDPGLNFNNSLGVEQFEVKVRSQEVWGAIRALETISQLVKRSHGHLYIAKCRLDDAPRFCHRGLLVDTARHYLSLKTLKKHLNAMMYSKMNVLHWHIVDDESFPFVSEKYPELAEKVILLSPQIHSIVVQGAFYPNVTIYRPEDIAEIVEYARLRGIRVIPEIDSPDHTRSWGKGRPELLTKCFTTDGEHRRLVDVANPEVWTFLTNILSEFANKFPDKWIHLGGDEVQLDCWSDKKNYFTLVNLKLGKIILELVNYSKNRKLESLTKNC
ncbi:hypothetical protein ACOME3_001340 [Neoechinorhynchus agilis]